jgi:pyruvate-formate lyase-activating enzyme
MNWHGIIEYAEKRLERAHVKKHGCTIRCPHCRAWWHVSKGRFIDRNISKRMVPTHLSIYDCGDCCEESYWNFGVAPTPLLECAEYNPEWSGSP